MATCETDVDIIELPVTFFEGPYVINDSLYSSGCVARAAPLCEGLPITHGHPPKPGGRLSIDDTYHEHVRRLTIGRVINPVYEYPRLRGTAVLDMNRVAARSPGLHSRIKAGEVIEVCISWNDIKGGKFPGSRGDRPYKYIVLGATPVNLALLHVNGFHEMGLTVSRGHCPVSEGFGLGVNNAI
jgi:hypothetical protein